MVDRLQALNSRMEMHMTSRRFGSVVVAASLMAMLATADAQKPSPSTSDNQDYASIVAAKGKMSETERLQRLIRIYLAEDLPPPSVTTAGGHRAVWVSRSEARFAADRRRAAARLEAVRSIDAAVLDPSARLDWQVLRSIATSDEELAQFPTEYAWPEWPDWDLWWRIDAHQRRSADDYHEILAWLRGVPITVTESIELMQRGLARGATATRADIQRTIENLRNVIPDEPMASQYLAPFKEFPDSIPAEDRQAFSKDAVTIYRTSIVPAYRTLLSYLETTYLPAGRQSPAMAALPKGGEWYAALVRRATGLSTRPEDIHETALAEVRRLREGILEIARTGGFDGPVEQFMAKVRSDPSCGSLDAAGVATEFQTMMRTVERGLPRLFGTIPKTPYEVRPVPSLPPGAAGGQARPGSLAEGRPGLVLIQTPVASRCSFFSLAMHEGLPGHLFQKHVASESGGMSELRRRQPSNAYSEGWAQYASGLAVELGMDRDTYRTAERINGELFMAVRAVIETGIHWKGWTRDDAIAFYKTNLPWGTRMASEIDAAIASPGRRLAYMVGHRRIVGLREESEKALGSRFDIRRFHDEVLRHGDLPLGVLDGLIKEWVSSQQR